MTARSLQVLRAVDLIHQQTGWMPSVRELANAVGLASPATVHVHLRTLERDKLIERKGRDSAQWRITAKGRAALSLFSDEVAA